MSVFFQKVITFSVLSILSAAFAACLLSIATPGAVYYAYGQYCYYTYYYYSSYSSCYTDALVNILTNLLCQYWVKFLCISPVYFIRILTINMAFKPVDFKKVIISFIHSNHFYSASSSPLILRSAPDTARTLYWSFTQKRHRQLQVKDLPKVPTWRLERDSNTPGASILGGWGSRPPDFGQGDCGDRKGSWGSWDRKGSWGHEIVLYLNMYIRYVRKWWF